MDEDGGYLSSLYFRLNERLTGVEVMENWDCKEFCVFENERAEICTLIL